MFDKSTAFSNTNLQPFEVPSVDEPVADELDGLQGVKGCGVNDHVVRRDVHVLKGKAKSVQYTS